MDLNGLRLSFQTICWDSAAHYCNHVLQLEITGVCKTCGIGGSHTASKDIKFIKMRGFLLAR